MHHNRTQSHQERLRFEKQQYLRKEILDQNYDEDEFTEWIATQKDNGRPRTNR